MLPITTTRQAAVDQGLKLLVYGQSGAGKTFLISTIPNPDSVLIISTETGLLSLRDFDIPVVIARSAADLYKIYDHAATHSNIRWIALDSLSDLAEAVLAAEKKLVTDPRKAYGNTQDQVLDLVRLFRDLPGRNIYVTCKMERIKDELSGGVLLGPMLPGQRLGQLMPYLFDFFLHLRVEKDQDGNPQRWLQTAGDFQVLAKDRSGALAPFEPPDLGLLAEKVHAHPHPHPQPHSPSE